MFIIITMFTKEQTRIQQMSNEAAAADLDEDRL